MAPITEDSGNKRGGYNGWNATTLRLLFELYGKYYGKLNGATYIMEQLWARAQTELPEDHRPTGGRWTKKAIQSKMAAELNSFLRADEMVAAQRTPASQLTGWP